MAINLIDTVMEHLKGPVLDQLGVRIGASPEQTRAATGAIVPAILAGVAERAATPEGTSLFGTILAQVDDGLLDKLGAVFKSDEADKMAESGSGLLSALFGEDALTTVIAGLAGAVGLGSDKVKALLGFVAPVALGALKRLITRKGLSLGWLTGLFAQQRSGLEHLLPHGLAGFVTTAAAVVETVVEDTADEPEVSDAPEESSEPVE